MLKCYFDCNSNTPLINSLLSFPPQEVNLDFEGSSVAVCKAAVWCLLDDWSTGTRKPEDLVITTGPNLFWVAKVIKNASVLRCALACTVS